MQSWSCEFKSVRLNYLMPNTALSVEMAECKEVEKDLREYKKTGNPGKDVF